MGRPRKEDAKDTRREILDAALDLFAEHGFSGTSMRQIAQAVGVRESALYHHFPSKDALFAFLADEMGPSRAEELTTVDFDVALKAGGAQPMIRGLAHRIIESWSAPREQKFGRMMMAEGLRGKITALNPHSTIMRAQERLAGFFKELMKRKAIRTFDPMVVGREFMGPLIVLRITQLLSGAPADRRRLKAMVDQHIDFLWRALQK